jgi:hypothetical protein
MTANSAAVGRIGTGGPGDSSSFWEHVAGWVLVVAVAMLVTQLGLM